MRLWPSCSDPRVAAAISQASPAPSPWWQDPSSARLWPGAESNRAGATGLRPNGLWEWRAPGTLLHQLGQELHRLPADPRTHPSSRTSRDWRTRLWRCCPSPSGKRNLPQSRVDRNKIAKATVPRMCLLGWLRNRSRNEKAHASSRAIRHSGPRQRTGRQVAGLAHGAIGAADRRRGAPMDRRLLSQHRLPAQQERDLEREGRPSCAPRRAVRHDDRPGRRSTWRRFASASATWWTRRSPRICRTTRRAAPN